MAVNCQLEGLGSDERGRPRARMTPSDIHLTPSFLFFWESELLEATAD